MALRSSYCEMRDRAALSKLNLSASKHVARELGAQIFTVELSTCSSLARSKLKLCSSP